MPTSGHKKKSLNKNPCLLLPFSLELSTIADVDHNMKPLVLYEVNGTTVGGLSASNTLYTLSYTNNADIVRFIIHT